MPLHFMFETAQTWRPRVTLLLIGIPSVSLIIKRKLIKQFDPLPRYLDPASFHLSASSPRKTIGITSKVATIPIPLRSHCMKYTWLPGCLVGRLLKCLCLSARYNRGPRDLPMEGRTWVVRLAPQHSKNRSLLVRSSGTTD